MRKLLLLLLFFFVLVISCVFLPTVMRMRTRCRQSDSALPVGNFCDRVEALTYELAQMLALSPAAQNFFLFVVRAPLNFLWACVTRTSFLGRQPSREREMLAQYNEDEMRHFQTSQASAWRFFSVPSAISRSVREKRSSAGRSFSLSGPSATFLHVIELLSFYWPLFCMNQRLFSKPMYIFSKYLSSW